MEINIRRVNVGDAAILSQLAKQTFFDTFSGTCTNEDMELFLADNYNLDVIKKELSNENNFTFFAEVNGSPVGYISFMEDYSSFPVMQQWKAIELKRIYILKEFHSKGIAQKLMDFFLEFCKQANYERIWLGVWEKNFRAQKFYEKYGFINSGYTHDFPIGKTPQMDYWFWKII